MNEISPELTGFYEWFQGRNFETTRRFAVNSRYDPENLKHFLEASGNPSKKIKKIHVAGTTGKGSVSTFLSRALATECSSGLFISPHLESIYERISINGNNIPEKDFFTIWDNLKKIKLSSTLSFFDALTAISLVYFDEKKTDWAVYETGLGGRLDSTNNIVPVFSVITKIGMDHEKILGNSIRDIALEKGGIIKPGVPVYVNSGNPEADSVFADIAREQKSEIKYFPESGFRDFREENLAFVRWIYEDFFSRPLPHFSSKVPGRFEEISTSPRIIFDSAHNPVSLEKLAGLVKLETNTAWNIYMNTLKERNLADFFQTMSQILSAKARFYLFPVRSDDFYKASDLEGVDFQNLQIEELKKLLSDTSRSHLVTGSMRLYSEIKRITQT